MARFPDNCPLDCKVCVDDLGSNGSRQELENAFGHYGPLKNVWLAQNPPGSAFVIFEESRDARDACRALNGKTICGRRVRVELSSEKTRREKDDGHRGSNPRRISFNATQLKEHYKTCISLSSTNKINSTNAFGLHIIDYLKQMVTQGNMNFTMATSALDAGTKIYVHRVDCVHSDAQKVANGIVQALDSKKSRKGQNDPEDEEGNEDNDAGGDSIDETGKKAKKKPLRRKREKGSTIVSEESLSLRKLETNVEIDPIFYKLTTSHDMGNINGLFLTNLAVSASSASLIMDSNSLNELSATSRNSVMEKARTSAASRSGSIVTLEKEYVDILRDCCQGTGKRSREKNQEARIKNHYRILGDKFLNDFIFARKESNLEVEYPRDTPSMWDPEKSEFTFNLNDPVVEDDFGTGPDHLELSYPDDGNSDDELMDMDTSGDHENRLPGGQVSEMQRSILQAVNLESVPDLKKLLSTEGGEYSYFKNLGVVGSWAGPEFWKKNVWLKMKQARELKTAGMAGVGEDGEPISSSVPPPLTSRKSRKMDFPLQEYTGLFPISCLRSLNLPDRLYAPHEVMQKLKVATLEKWNANAQFIILPTYQRFDPSCLLKPDNKPGTYFSLVEDRATAASRSRTNSVDRRTTDYGSNPSSPTPSDDGFDGFPASSQQTHGVTSSQADAGISTAFNPFGMTGSQIVSSQQTQATFAGSNLVDAPDMIQHVVIPFAKYAKRMDVKKLKRAILSRINAVHVAPEDSFTGCASTSNNLDSVPSQSPLLSSQGVKLSEVYLELPREIPPQMTKDMSPAIAFVTLLHLANEHNLVLGNESRVKNSEPAQLLASYTRLDAFKDVQIRKERQGEAPDHSQPSSS